MPLIATYSGRTVDPLKLRPADVAVDDIAHSLAHQCRFNGHCRDFYSVAQHSVLVAESLEQQSVELARWGLLHDAAEAYLGDVVRPLKNLLSFACVDYQPGTGASTLLPKITYQSFTGLENNSLVAIARRFRLPIIIPPAVAAEDLRALATERRDLLPHAAGDWDCLKGVEPWAEKITPWPPGMAEDEFLANFHRLFGGLFK